MYVYLIKNNLNGKCYVGQTSQKRIERRWQAHCSLKKNIKYQPLIKLAINKYGKENFTFSVLAICTTKEELDRLERKYITEYNSISPNGYNLMTGGTSGYEFHEETKQKMSEVKLGTSLPETTKERMSISHKERWKSEELRQGMSQHMKERWQDPEYCNKITNVLNKRWASEEAHIIASEKAKAFTTEKHKRYISEQVKKAQAKPEVKAKMDEVYKKQQRPVIDDNGIIYQSIKEAAEKNNCHGSTIIKVLKGRYKTAGGRIFKYLEEKETTVVTTLPTLYLICGVPGAGKSWVCNQLTNCSYISFDGNSKKDHLELLQKAGESGLPVCYDPTFKISTFIKRHGHLFNIKAVFIIESDETLKQRIAGRGGEWTDSLTKRIKQITKRSEKYGVFSGTSNEVLSYMLNELRF
jgi:group I intron endonuclease